MRLIKSFSEDDFSSMWKDPLDNIPEWFSTNVLPVSSMVTRFNRLVEINNCLILAKKMPMSIDRRLEAFEKIGRML